MFIILLFHGHMSTRKPSTMEKSEERRIETTLMGGSRPRRDDHISTTPAKHNGQKVTEEKLYSNGWIKASIKNNKSIFYIHIHIYIYTYIHIYIHIYKIRT